MADLVLSIDGMMCQKNCANTVAKAIRQFPAVKEVIVTHATGLAEVWIHENSELDASQVIDEIEAIGYGASIKENHLKPRDSSSPTDGTNIDTNTPDVILYVKKLNRLQDLKIIETALIAVDGVLSLDFELSNKLVYVWGFADSSALIDALKRVKYDAVDQMQKPRKDELITSIEEESTISPLSSAVPSASSSASPSSSKREYVYSIRGMSCGACATKIERMLRGLPGVATASVSVMTHQGQVKVDDDLSPLAIGPRDIIHRIQDLGYDCTLESGDTQKMSSSAQDNNAHDLQQWQYLLIISLVFGLPVLSLHFLGQYIPPLMEFLMSSGACEGGVTKGQLCMLCLNLPLMFLVGYKYYHNALLSAYHGMLGMDFLVMLGTSITFIYSLFQLLLACEAEHETKQVFFETSGMLLLFVTIGKYIEAYAKGKSASAMKELLELQPLEALVVTGESLKLIHNAMNNSHNIKRNSKKHLEVEINIDEQDINKISVDLIQKHDIVKVYAGDRIPTDGIIVLGNSYVDESMITGESLPVLKNIGEKVYGSTLNTHQVLYVKVTAYGSDSALAQIVKLVESAQLNKAPVQAYADYLASIFVPVIVLLSILTFTVWYLLCVNHIVPVQWLVESYNDPVLFSLLFAMSVVVVSCPCALGLATPTAIMVGTMVGAKNGVLIKGGKAFEVAQKVNTIVFDKTGTLTEGRPKVTDVLPLGESTAETVSETKRHLLLLAATAEQNSDHPLAKAIAVSSSALSLNPLPLPPQATTSFLEGVLCSSPLGEIIVGNRNFLRERGVSLPPAADSLLWGLEIGGKTALSVCLNGGVVGVLGVADPPKPEAEGVIRYLKSRGLDVWMLTGDHKVTAEALAGSLSLSLDRVIGGMKPNDKAVKVTELKAMGKVVLMVGDGVNDSPALVTSDLGVAIGGGTQIAIESAQIILMRSSLLDLLVAMDLSRVVFQRVKLNFLWAGGYNLLALPLAAGVGYPFFHFTLPPHYAGLAMALSSISVVLSSLSLWWYKRPSFEREGEIEGQRVERVATGAVVGGEGRKTRGVVCACCCAWGREGEYAPLPVEEKGGDELLGLELGLGRRMRGGKEIGGEDEGVL